MKKSLVLLKACNAIRVPACVLLVMGCTGCGTLVTHRAGDVHEAYTGVRMDAKCVSQGTGGFVIDMPFSAVADTMLLPIDLWPEPKNPVADWTYHSGESTSGISNTNQLAQEILEDYHNFVTRNASMDRGNPAGFYEDGKGRCAILVTSYLDNGHCIYVLIYNEKYQRIKVVKFNRHKSFS